MVLLLFGLGPGRILTFNKIKSLPSALFAYSTSLQNLYLRGNQIEQLVTSDTNRHAHVFGNQWALLVL